MKLIQLYLLGLFLFFSGIASHAQLAGQECFPKKNPDKLVYDETGVLGSQFVSQLESDLQSFAISSSNEIYVVVVADLCGMDKAQFAIELGELWGAGQEKEDNGIIVLVKPKTDLENGKTFIAIGRGLEGAIPDGETYLIVENEMIPQFKTNNYEQGLANAIGVLKSLAQGEYNIEAYKTKHQKKGLPVGVILVFVLLLIAVFVFAKSFQVRQYAKLNNLGFWAAWALLSSLSNTHSGSWQDFNRGRGGFGGWSGGSGGGFGGFGGGGSFGGGGAGGEW